jgi:hypothetical protein
MNLETFFSTPLCSYCRAIYLGYKVEHVLAVSALFFIFVMHEFCYFH